MKRVFVFVVAFVSGASACELEPETCEEDIRALVLDERIDLTIGGLSITAELADAPSERERGWKHRVCDRVAILLVPDPPTPTTLPVWGCGLTTPIDAYFIVDSEVVAIERIEPCPEPCGACPTYGATIEVDAILEVPADALANVELGAAVRL